MGLERRTRAAVAAAAAAAAAATTTPLPPSRHASSSRSISDRSSSTTTTASSSAGSGSSSGTGTSQAKQQQQKTIAILLLAHDGVANPGLWERWRRSSGPAYAARVRFFVFRNERLAFPSAFADTYDLGLRLPTQWCASSTTHASLQAVQRVLEADPQCAQLFLVSGRDVPVFPPRVLFHPRRVTTEGTRYHLRPFASLVCQAEPHWQDELKDEELWEEAAAGRNPYEALIREHAVCHNTFLALSRRHARLLLRFPHECPLAYRRLLRLGDHRRFIPLTCPEEWLLGTMLRLLLNGPTQHKHDDVGALLQLVRALTEGEATKMKKKKTKKAEVAVAAATAMTTPAASSRRRALSVIGSSACSSNSNSSSNSSGSGWTDGEAASVVDGSASSFSDEEDEDEDEPVRITRRQTRSRGSTDVEDGEAGDRYAQEVVNWPLTDQNRQEADDPSPLTWASWERDPHLILYAPGDQRLWTLRDALRSAQANGHLFYRKVGPLSQPEVAQLCAELYGLGVEEEEEEEEQEEGGGDVLIGSGSGQTTLLLGRSLPLPIEAALLARAAKRARRNGGGGGGGVISPLPPTTTPNGGGIGGITGRRYTLRVPTRHCVADGSGGLYCALLTTTPTEEGRGKRKEDDMALRRGRLETLAKGRR